MKKNWPSVILSLQHLHLKRLSESILRRVFPPNEFKHKILFRKFRNLNLIIKTHQILLVVTAGFVLQLLMSKNIWLFRSTI